MEGLKSFVSGLYWQPFNPSTETPLKDRYQLALEAVRPWSEFLNLSEFNLPPLGQIKDRVRHNLETFQYNYLMLACIHIFFFTLAHSGTMLVLVGWLALMYVMFFKYTEDIEVGDGWTIDAGKKKMIAGVTGLLALFVGGVITFVVSLTVFAMICVGIHATFRDSSSDLDLQEATI